jgi:hypothetical protein
MANVVSITVAQKQKDEQALLEREYHRANAVHSPVPDLIELLEPIIDSVKGDPKYDAQNDISEFIELLNTSRQEIDQLEDMAKFLLNVNAANG